MKTEWRGTWTAAVVSSALAATVCASAQSTPSGTPASGSTAGGAPIQVASAAASAAAASTVAATGTAATTGAAKAAQSEPLKLFGLTLFGQERLRVEDYNWWGTSKANGAYTFLGSELRFGAKQSTANNDIVFELENPALINLPTRAVAGAPQGQLGAGATYFVANGSQDNNVSNIFIRQGYVRFKTPGPDVSSLRVGRFEYSDGAELPSKDSTLTWLINNRVKERLIGPSNFPDVGRSFDGLEVAQTSPTRAISGFAAFPTRGVYDVEGMDTLTGIKVASLSSTVDLHGRSSVGQGRLFAIYYQDDRGDVKVDDRSAAAKAGDKNPIRLETVGGNYTRVYNIGPGKFDMLAWAAGQWGAWGKQEQAAYAYDAELGYQFTHPSWKPWFRGGIAYFSGDGNPNNGTHATFVPLLFSARPYFQDTIATASNLQDLFLSAIFRSPVRAGAPAGTLSRFTVRTELHAYALANSHDLWYGGTGAYNNSIFGYTGRASGGFGSLATTADISLGYQPSKSLQFTLYVSYANGGDVVASIYNNRDMTFSYAEATYKF